MKHILSIIFVTSVLWANTPFVKEEQSTFSSSPTPVVEEVKTKEITTYEQTANETQTEAVIEEQNTIQEINPQVLKEEPPQNASVKVLNELLQDAEQNNDNMLYDDGDEIVNQEEIEELPIDYFSPVVFDNATRAKSLYLSYVKYPKKIYKNQRFEVVLKALVTTDDFYKVETRFIDSNNMTVLNPENVWVLKDNNTFENTYYFKAYEENFTMPTFQVLLYQDNEIVEVQTITPQEMTFTEIAKEDEKFSSVIAQNIKINAYKTKQYNNNELITILDVKGIKSNLEDFHLRYVQEQGFSQINDNYPEQSMLYYLVLPVHKKKISFTYYSTQDNRFRKITVPVKLENELVSTQTDLNPNNSNMLFYKKIAFSVLSVLFLVLFAWKRKYIYLVALLISLIFLIMYMMPNRQAYIKADTTIYILPTNNSTIFYKTTQSNLVQVAMKREHFVKIIMNINNQKIIGWIKEEQLVKN